jgi:DNA polymerase I-like protein with 3'-5' exonuclease and polymerase domains
VKWIGQNFLYDMTYTTDWWNATPNLDFDTMVAQNLLFPGSQKDLGFLSSLYCEHHVYWKDDNRDWSDTGTLEQHLLYNGIDCCRTFEIAEALKVHLQAEGLEQMWEFERWKILLAWRMSRHGIKVDQSRRKGMSIQVVERQMHLLETLTALVPQDLVKPLDRKKPVYWPDSSHQVKTVLYELLKLPAQSDRKTGNVTTGDEAIQKLKESHPFYSNFLEMLLDYRSMKVFNSTFLTSKLEWDGMMRCSFNPAGTETYRWSSSKNTYDRGANMQNIPQGSDEE